MKTIFFVFIALLIFANANAQAPRKVIVEDFTGLWCGWCPLGKTVVEHLESTFGNAVIDIGMHDYDSLESNYSRSIDSINNYGYPGGLVDRAVYQNKFFRAIGAVDYSGTDLDAAVNARLAVPSPLSLQITSIYTSSTRLASITLSANFVANTSGNMRINCILVEDSILTNDSQSNYMDADPLSPWYNQGDPIYFYVQRNTARINLSATAWGDKNCIPTSVNSGASYSKNYNYVIPTGWNANHIKIVGFVSKWGSSTSSASAAADTNSIYILNANEAALGQSTGTNENLNYGLNPGNNPNPFSDKTVIPIFISTEKFINIKIYNIFGVEVKTLFSGNLTSGHHTFDFDGTDDNGTSLANGIYVYRLITDKGCKSQYMVLNR